MKIVSAFVAHSADQHDGLLHTVGAYPEWWGINDLPSDVTFTLVVVAEFSHHEVGRSETIELVQTGYAGDESRVGDLTFHFGEVRDYVEGAPVYSFGILPLQVHVDHVGPMVITVRQDGEDLASARLSFRLVPTD